MHNQEGHSKTSQHKPTPHDEVPALKFSRKSSASFFLRLLRAAETQCGSQVLRGAKLGVCLFRLSCSRNRNDLNREGHSMGRPRKPTKLKILEGNPGRRPLNKSEPEYAPTVLKPDDLSEVAAEWWGSRCTSTRSDLASPSPLTNRASSSSPRITQAGLVPPGCT